MRSPRSRRARAGRGWLRAPSPQDELYPLVLAALALVAGDLHLPDLAGVGDVGAAVGLGVYALDLNDPDRAHTLGHEVDLRTDEVRVLERLLTRQLVDLHRARRGERLVRESLYLAYHLHGPLAGEGEIHPGAIDAHLAAGDLRPEVLPDY